MITWEAIIKGIVIMDATLLTAAIVWTLIIVTYKIVSEGKK
ncbi:hypothetical protein LCGC14_1406330 [marine sediment metagenome]|uniref:Uncharacterized protein n=1 Tax=marine sediment metagenome TaxID=412755 RepID=A0A0F9MX65_9ZZZZ